jgi:2-polyprenyl-3-methyl-5-hydroxy-6-metoxy-1,4-benzoquinol methylase
MSIDKNQINEYFANYWRSNSNFHYTGVNYILNLIGPKDEILDVGCGYNLFKEHLGSRLYAFDPALDYGDELTDVENFNPKGKQWDVVLCLGSINFGDISIIRPQVEKVISLVKPRGRIIWRQNPGRQDHSNEECKKIDFFPWTFEWNYQLARDNGCKVTDIKWDRGYRSHRIYSLWIKK